MEFFFLDERSKNSEELYGNTSAISWQSTRLYRIRGIAQDIEEGRGKNRLFAWSNNVG